jgi:hypothetical protein
MRIYGHGGGLAFLAVFGGCCWTAGLFLANGCQKLLTLYIGGKVWIGGVGESGRRCSKTGFYFDKKWAFFCGKVFGFGGVDSGMKSCG